MTTGRSIVGIGELWAATDDSDAPGGLAASIPALARRIGRPGVSISRVGQDAAGAALLAALRAAGVDAEHIQTDPDLDTARLIVRRIGPRVTRALDARAAFDNLQWDFDLEDVAQQTDAVVFGLLARRHHQASTTTDRFIAMCRGAVRVFDGANREDGQSPERAVIARALENAEGAVFDLAALRALAPSADEEAVVCSLLRRQHRLAFIVIVEDGAWRLHVDEGTFPAERPIERESRHAATVGLLHALISGLDWPRCARAASRLAAFAHDRSASIAPRDMFD
jgi:sugar/nucleoside kinase (ribokinase family)